MTRAKQLLAEAGYPNGFEVTLDCPNNRYVNDEQICTAVAAMLTRSASIRRSTTQPRATYFPKLEKLDTSMYMLGWGGAITDAQTTLSPVYSRSMQQTGNGELQLRPLRQPEARRADRRCSGRDERREAQDDHPGCHRNTTHRCTTCRCTVR